MNTYVIKVHCGSAHVRGKAKNYPYFIASKFVFDGIRYRNSGVVCGPYRSFDKCCREAKEFANKKDYLYIEGYGSLHNKRSISNLDTKNAAVIITFPGAI